MKVRNLATGLVHEVPAGHPALDDGLHQRVVESPPDPAAAATPEPEPEPDSAPEPPRKRAPARRARK